MGLSVDPIHSYTFNNTWEDSHGGVDIVNTGAVFDNVNSKVYPYSAKYDGIDDFGVIGDSSTLKLLHGGGNPSSFAWTIFFWLRFPDPNTGGNDVFFSTGQGDSTKIGFDLFYDNTTAGVRQIRSFIANSNPGQFILNYTSGNIYPNDSDFHLMEFTYDQSVASSNFNIKIDNALVGTGNKSAFTPASVNSTNAAHIAMLGNEILPADINMNQLLIFDEVVTAADEDYIWNGGAGVDLFAAGGARFNGPFGLGRLGIR